jgi:hypothetical protein
LECHPRVYSFTWDDIAIFSFVSGPEGGGVSGVGGVCLGLFFGLFWCCFGTVLLLNSYCFA